MRVGKIGHEKDLRKSGTMFGDQIPEESIDSSQVQRSDLLVGTPRETSRARCNFPYLLRCDISRLDVNLFPPRN